MFVKLWAYNEALNSYIWERCLKGQRSFDLQTEITTHEKIYFGPTNPSLGPEFCSFYGTRRDVVAYADQAPQYGGDASKRFEFDRRRIVRY